MGTDCSFPHEVQLQSSPEALLKATRHFPSSCCMNSVSTLQDMPPTSSKTETATTQNAGHGFEITYTNKAVSHLRITRVIGPQGLEEQSCRGATVTLQGPLGVSGQYKLEHFGEATWFQHFSLALQIDMNHLKAGRLSLHTDHPTTTRLQEPQCREHDRLIIPLSGWNSSAMKPS